MQSSLTKGFSLMIFSIKHSIKAFKQDILKALVFGGLAFVIIINYAILRTLKDGFVVKNMGAEAIGFLKFYLLIPATILFLLIYTKLSSKFPQRVIFHWVSMFFLLCFVFLFFSLFVLSREKLSSQEILYYESFAPRFKWFIRVALNWEYSFLYILAELWGAIIYTLFFFQLANSVFAAKTAKAFYPLIILCGNLSLPFTGALINFLHGNTKNLIIIVIIVNVLTILFYKLLALAFKAQPMPKQAQKIGSSLIENLRFILSSNKLWLLFVMMVSLGISLNVVEVFWKGKLGKLSGSVEEYVQNMGAIQAMQGWSSIIFLLLGMFILRRFSWRFSSLFAPVFLFCAGTIFFALIFLGGDLDTILFFGVAHTIMGRCLKYTFFDPSKEFVYISLDENFRTKGKATVDLLGGRFGKSGLGVLESVVFFIFPAGTFDSTALFFGGVFLCVAFVWVQAVIALDKRLKIQ